MNLLLDTATFLWWASGDPAVNASVRAAVQDPARRVFVSAVSAWEIAVKHALGKLPLPETPETLVPRWRSEHGFEELGLSEAAALKVCLLPSLHGDPFDRMLICQAIEDGLTLVTPDESIRAYPVRTLW